jgi:Reverse transcriptase (RNA-dependent DNA polymerase)
MNDTMNPEGLVPSYLVFGIMPRLMDQNTKLPIQAERMKAVEVARAEMETITSEIRLRKALKSNIPAATNQNYDIGQKVLVYRERDNPPWQGPYNVTKIENKQIFIDRNGKEVQHSVSQVKPFIIESKEGTQDTLHCNSSPLDSTLNNQIGVNLTETLHPADPRATSSQFMDAKKREIKGLMNKNTWKIVDKETIPKDANILNGRFVLTIKNANSDDEICKARYVVQGHKDREKSLLVHNSTTVRQSSTRLIMTLAATFGFRIWSQDVKQAYLQSSDNLMRQVFLRPSKEFELPPGKLLKLQKPLYGLADSGDYWYNTMSKHIKDDIGMKSTTGDMSFFYKHIGNNLVGLTGTYVDDSLLAGNLEFEKLTKTTMDKFESRDREMDNTKFAGVNITTTDEGFDLDQNDYIARITLLSIDCNFTDFRSKRAQLSWITHTRPEICCAVNMASQVTEKSFSVQKINDLNKVIKHLKSYPSQALKYYKLDKDTLKLKVYADSSFANNDDFTSQLGYIVLLTDKTDRCNIIHYSSHKSRRVTRSVLGGEVYAFADAFDFAFTLKHDLQVMLRQAVPLTILTDSKSLFDVITKSSTISERRLMIDITAVRNAYNAQELSDVGFVRTKYNPADAFTKLGFCESLDTIIKTGMCSLPIEQWVIRGNETMLHTQSSEEGGV